MTKEDAEFLERINAFADKALKDVDGQNTRVGYQLQQLKPVMEEIAAESGETVESVFIRYMDLASERSVELERKFQTTVGNMNQYGDIM
ncbi:MAG: hypothetical protein K6B44_01460 [Lachnospiraceae bacterium]|nr:hypothetical protein [Lachnospiraceae bacterium]